ncbi:vWA domain-containing protein [Singulisphaera sp. PoT]|uniref:vWA domain-containing protein n=1 Tax=Singulisphaera sp. PoT TaxID=3411797 RepID=UPI003BF5F502
MRWAEPGWMILFVLVPLPWVFDRMRPRLAWPSLGYFPKAGRFGARGRHAFSLTLRGLAISSLVMALARPQTVGGRTHIAGQGVAIMVALDQSSSMNAADFPSERGPIKRLDAARNTVSRFVASRPDDLLGLVVFANYPDLACPPTLDHAFMLETVQSLRTARPGDDGTNLGDAIAWSLEALSVTTPKKRVLIVMTDGRNSPAVPSPLDPRAAAILARELGITLHTIAIGKAEAPPPPPPTSNKEEAKPNDAYDTPDFELLDTIAKLGGGRAFVAANARDLEKVFKTIDTLEKSPVQSIIRTRYREHYASWVAFSIGLLILDRLCSVGRLRRLP